MNPSFMQAIKIFILDCVDLLNKLILHKNKIKI
jgi:hypothetical protein